MAQLDPSVQQLFNLSPAQQEEFAMGMELGQTPEAQMQVAQLLPQFIQKQEDPLSNLFKMDLGGTAPAKKEAAPTKKKAPTPVAKKAVEKAIAKAPAAVPSAPATVSMPDLVPSEQFKLPQNLNPLDFGPQIQTQGGPFTPEGVKYSQNILELQTPGMRQQRATLDEVRKMISGAEAPIPQQNIAWLMGLSDILTDSDTLSKYKTPEQQKYEQKMNKAGALLGLSKEEGDLTKSEIDLFKANYISDLQHTLGLTKEDVKQLIAGKKIESTEGMQDKTIAATSKEKQLDRESAERIAKIRAAQKASKEQRSKFWDAYDTAAAKDLQIYDSTGKAEAAAGMASLKNAIDALKSNPDLSGSAKAIAATATGFGEATAIRDSAWQSMITSMRPILGAQFTEREGNSLKKLIYDPKQPASENIRRMTLLMSKLQEIKASKDAASAWAKSNPSMRGFQGSIYDESHFSGMSANSFYQFMGSGGGGGTAAPKAKGPVTRTYKGKTYKLKEGGNSKNQSDWEVQ